MGECCPDIFRVAAGEACDWRPLPVLLRIQGDIYWVPAKTVDAIRPGDAK